LFLFAGLHALEFFLRDFGVAVYLFGGGIVGVIFLNLSFFLLLLKQFLEDVVKWVVFFY